MTMTVLRMVPIWTLVFWTSLYEASADLKPREILAQKQRLVRWLRSEDGFFSEKISFLPPNADPDLETGGIFALEPISKGEKIMFIPKHCLFRPPRNSRGKVCDTVKRLVDEYQEGEEHSDHWPYVQYVFESFRHDHLPTAWSNDAMLLVQNIVGTEILEPQHFGDFDPCEQYYKPDDDEYNELLDSALRIVQSRGWIETLVPVFDMGNHRNGYWHNMDQLHDSKTHKDFEIVALRDIEAGEQLYLSYNECPDQTCEGEAHTFITPNLFRVYGFVEQYPQRWEFTMGSEDDDYVLFELDEAPKHATTTTGKGEKQALQVTWLTENHKGPNPEQLQWLQVNLKRLKGMRDYVLYEAAHLAPNERESILSYYSALMQAMEQAIVWGGREVETESRGSEYDDEEDDDDGGDERDSNDSLSSAQSLLYFRLPLGQQEERSLNFPTNNDRGSQSIRQRQENQHNIIFYARMLLPISLTMLVAVKSNRNNILSNLVMGKQETRKV